MNIELKKSVLLDFNQKKNYLVKKNERFCGSRRARKYQRKLNRLALKFAHTCLDEDWRIIGARLQDLDQEGHSPKLHIYYVGCGTEGDEPHGHIVIRLDLMKLVFHRPPDGQRGDPANRRWSNLFLTS